VQSFLLVVPGQRHREVTAFAGFAFDRDASTMRLGDRLDDRQPQSASSGGPAARFVHPVESVVNKGQVLLRYAHALIDNLQVYHLSVCFGTYTCPSARVAVAKRIFKQVSQQYL